MFARGPKGMELTPPGSWARSLLETAERAERAERAVLDVRDERRGLRLGALETLVGSHVPLVLPLPDLSLRLVWRAGRETLPGTRDVLYAAARP
ncbi:hypothetical protein [Streptomyces sp. NPDC057877]|uniref:hypothetical protein n=1 Tax=Streptomyces sp. NPDC057877 TaxID=3346269 RepID=UPI0036BC78AB